MFVRFSDQEDINTYTPTATNTAGTQRLADGSEIRGAIRGRDAIYVWTDTALFTQRFVGSPFTFAFSQVGTNCGLAGQNACVEVDGAAYWMSENGFFRYAGKLESLPCLVEDFVFDDINMESGNQMISAGLNNLFGEVMWFYPQATSTVVNRMVSYNYFDSSPRRPVWTIGSLSRTMWQDSAVFPRPHALELMKIRRFIPDFISQTGNAQVTLELRNFPNDTKASSALGPFTVTTSTQKVDTRARARAISLKVANTGASQSWKLGTFRLDIQPDGRR
jgi:hypothetical protein